MTPQDVGVCRRGRWRAVWAALLPLACLVVVSADGCSSDSSRQPTSRSTDAALNDPANYKPSFEDTSISGGGIGHFDKEGFKRDLKSVFDP